MLQVSRDQFDDLGHRALMGSLRDHWKDTFPASLRTLSETELKRLASQAVQAAERAGIRGERDLFTWVDLCLVARTNFAARLLAPVTGSEHAGR